MASAKSPATCVAPRREMSADVLDAAEGGGGGRGGAVSQQCHARTTRARSRVRVCARSRVRVSASENKTQGSSRGANREALLQRAGLRDARALLVLHALQAACACACASAGSRRIERYRLGVCVAQNVTRAGTSEFTTCHRKQQVLITRLLAWHYGAPQCQNSRSLVGSLILIPTIRRAWLSVGAGQVAEVR